MLCIVKILNKNVSKYINEILYEISEIHTVTSQQDEQPNEFPLSQRKSVYLAQSQVQGGSVVL